MVARWRKLAGMWHLGGQMHYDSVYSRREATDHPLRNRQSRLSRMLAGPI